MRRGLRTVTVGLCLAVLALTSGCSAMNDGSVAPELGADARVGARQTMHRVIDWDGGEAVHRVDATWTDSCGHASNSGFFQPAAGTTCRIDAGVVYTIDGATTPVDAVRIVGPALRAGGLTDEDLVAQAIRPDGSTPSLIDVGGRQSIALGSDVGQDRFAVVRVRGWDQSLGLWQPDGSSVVQSAPGLGVVRRDDAVRASGADYVLVVTHSADYFTSYDNEPPEPPAPRPSVPPCFSGSNDCVGG
ncbi:hypothetical protein [Curtobacterium sp. MCLR17_054]|uniref:hypothetical protein n=1 Tax=Curtobacterium sp. MCLR17_054 TaxID=2175632 RepID=UPI0011B70313|nr:hypothetical protein [Curtobacterium sp. MCLR17_054]WIE70040.1 hypothetical protein DEJ08_008720 [Curtobacterium sp. MCLR17_054]